MRGILSSFRDGAWHRDLRESSWFTRAFFLTVRTVVHIAGNFERHMLSARAGALTMTTLLAVVPLAAVVFSVARAFGFGQELDQGLVNFSAELPAHFQDAIAQVRELVAAIDFRQLGAFSSLIVLYTGMSLFVRVERALNRAWQSSVQRSWLRRFSDFVALVVVVPGLALGGMTLSSLLQSAAVVDSWREAAPWLGWLYEAGLGFLPYVMMGLALTALYKFMPSARVRWRPALVGGFVAGAALLFMHGLYIHFQIGVAQNNAIYATLAALPLLIVYLQLAWLLVLLGAELSHAVQHVDALGFGREAREASPVLRERIALAIVDRVVRSFASGEGGIELGVVSTDLDVPRSMIESVCAELVTAELIARVGAERVLPARPGDKISLEDVRAAIRGEIPVELRARLELSQPIEHALDQAEDAQLAALRDVRFSASA